MWGKRRQAMLAAGAQAPAFELKDLAGKAVSLADILARGPALLAFFKIGCPVCQFTFPFLERMKANPHVQIVGISQDDAEATQYFHGRFGISFPTLIDDSGHGYPVSNAFGISSVPTLFLVEPDGRIATSFNGFSKRDLESLGERLTIPPFQPGEKVPEFKAG